MPLVAHITSEVRALLVFIFHPPNENLLVAHTTGEQSNGIVISFVDLCLLLYGKCFVAKRFLGIRIVMSAMLCLPGCAWFQTVPLTGAYGEGFRSGCEARGADVIFVMEPKHLQRLRAEYARLLEHKLIHVLEIPDDFQYMDPELVELLESAVGEYLEG